MYGLSALIVTHPSVLRKFFRSKLSVENLFSELGDMDIFSEKLDESSIL